MVYENVEFAKSNLSIFPRDGNYCSIDHDSNVMRIKNSSGDLIWTYTLVAGVEEIVSLEYPGPTHLSLAIAQLGDELPFFSLEHIDSEECRIREWRLDTTNNKLDLYKQTTITGTQYDCYDMAIEYYHTDFDGATTTGTGKIKLTNYSNVATRDKLLLGPSGDTDNLFAFEWVEVTSVSGGWVYITSDGLTPPHYEYADEDEITYYKSIFLFSDVDQSGAATKGSLYKIDPDDGSVLDVQNSGLYSGVRASAWSIPYQCIGMVKGSNLLYIDPNNEYEIQKSHALTNIEFDDVTIIPIYDLIFDSSTIYRLQKKITLKDDGGGKATTTWTTYNYHQDTIAPYTSTISLAVDPDGVVLNDDAVEITAVVRDQFGVGLLGKLIYFTRSGGDPSGSFDPVDGQVTTNASGIATITYVTWDYDTGGTNAEINIKAKTDGASTLTGSQYVWDNVSLFLYTNFTTELINLTQKPTLEGTWPTEGSDLYTEVHMTQVSGMENEFGLKQLSKFQFPGGAWVGIIAPSDEAKTLRQLLAQEDTVNLRQIEELDIETSIFQDKEKSNDLQISQTFISRHLLAGHKDDVDIDQFRFIEDAIPAFWSEKNPVNTNIWIRLRPFAFSLNSSSLIFKVREVSYAGDTGYTDVVSSCTVTIFDAGGGLLGLDILYNPPNDFHHNAVVYVDIEVYDTATTPNIIIVDYWFKVIPDFKAPYITNEDPARGEEDVAINTNIEFDIKDTGEGVNISSLELYINNRRVTGYTTAAISGGYHINYNPSDDFYYGETVEITVKADDTAANQNVLYDMWRFYCVGSTGPWIDRGSFDPKACARGVYRKQTGISFNVYGIDDTGVDQESILVTIGGKERSVTITPIIYRLE